MAKRSDYKGQPKQFYWSEEEKQGFESLCKDYDPHLSTNKGILKLINWAVKEHWLPDYIRKDAAKPAVQNRTSEMLDSLSPNKKLYE